MSAITTPFEAEQIQLWVRTRLWVGSAFAVLAAHVAVAALLLLHFQWQQPILRGTADALDVEIAGPSPPSAAPSVAVPQPQPARPSSQPQPAASIQAKPLPEIHPIPQQAETQSPSVAPADTASATLAAAQASVLATPDLTGFAPTPGQANAPPSPEQAWLAQIVARLQRYKSYPRGAVKRHQEDTVTLQFTVNPAGQVVYSKIDSKRHYKALENEVRNMLRLAVPLPAPPRQLSQLVVDVPVNFSLTRVQSSSAVTHCVKPADPGMAPSGAGATLAQMQTYRQHLNQYLAAVRSELDCLGDGSGQAGPASRSAEIDRVHALVDDFNAQARTFQAEATAREAMQAQQARQAAAARLEQAQAAAARAYAACTPPSARRPSAAATLTADTVQSYRKQLVGYEASVSAYLACINRAHVASAAQAGSALTAAQRAELDRTAVQLANVAVLPFDQLAVGFNAQLQRLQALAAATRARELKEQAALARAQAILPNSAWDTPAPLPRDECIRITRSGQTYQAQLCRSTYVTQISVDDDHGFSGTMGDIGKARGPTHGPQITSYSVSDLEVIGSHVILTIGRISGAVAGARDSVHFDLVLSQDGRSLRGQCWTEHKRWGCQLPRHH